MINPDGTTRTDKSMKTKFLISGVDESSQQNTLNPYSKMNTSSSKIEFVIGGQKSLESKQKNRQRL